MITTGRGIKEAIKIRREKPTLNADEGRYHLSQIWMNTIKSQSKNTLQHSLQIDPQQWLQQTISDDDLRQKV